MHTPATPSDHQRAKRGRITGWTAAAVRRHNAWLRSIAFSQLSGFGYAITLTMGKCPESPEAFHAARRAILMRLERAGAIRVHWVVEWTRRKVPHLHIAAYFPSEQDPRAVWAIKEAWAAVAGGWIVGARGQDIKPISGSEGWFKYLSKHAARGVNHYQRTGKPAGWETTGRLWGHTGEWPVAEPFVFAVGTAGWHHLRRLVRSWRVADARAERVPAVRRKRLSAARRCLSCGDRSLSTVRGLSEWVPESVMVALLAVVAEAGHEVTQTG